MTGDRGLPASGNSTFRPKLAPGSLVRQRYRKYDGSPHWQFETYYLGSDEFGHWLGGRPGSVCERPGLRFIADVHWVTLIPEDDWFVATFNDQGGSMGSRIYVDLSSVPQWRGDEVRSIDLDLDVIRRFGSGEVFLDDADEFEDHRVRFGYPPELVETVRRTAEGLLVAVRDGAEPFGVVGAAWLDRCKALLIAEEDI